MSDRFRGAVLTIFQISDYETLPSDKLSYFAYGKESCPTTGRSHLQAFAYAKNAMRLTQWKKIFPTAHIENMKGTFVENEKYCSKQSSLIEFGVRPKGDGCRADLENFCDLLSKGHSLKEVALEMPQVFVQYNNGLTRLAAFYSKPYEHDDVRGVWIYGVPGAGKSHYARDHYKDLYIKAQNKWFDGYNGERSILLDDFDCGKPLGHYLKIWTDKYACSGEIKGGTVNLQHHYFIVTSNYSIQEMFQGDEQLIAAITRRCKIIHMPAVFKRFKVCQ